MLRPRSLGRLTIATLGAAITIRATEVERLVSLEDPRFDPAKASLSAGLDGRVYLTGFRGDRAGYVMSLNPDGGDRRDGDTVYALSNATANRDGLIATANAHFSHSVNLYDRQLRLQVSNNDFKNGDDVRDWTAPSRVVAAPSGDFYALDHNRHQVVRLDDRAQVREVYAYTLPQGVKATAIEVDEAGKLFHLSDRRSKIWGVDFAGEVYWELAVPAFTAYALDASGVLHVLPNTANEVKRYQVPGRLAPEGERAPVELPPLPLHLGDHAISRQHPVRGLAVLADNRLAIQRRHPTELFLVADAEGKLVHRVDSRFRRLRVDHAEEPWTAGSSVAFAVDLTGEGAGFLASEPPRWQVWATPFGDNAWERLAWNGAELQVPAQAAGLLHVRVQNSPVPDASSQYRADTVVEVRAPDSHGTLSVWTPNNRAGFARGEAIPVMVSLRRAEPDSVKARLILEGAGSFRRELATLAVGRDAPATFAIASGQTADLAPGRYRLRALSDGFTSAPQALRLGPFVDDKPAFRTSLGADYTNHNLVNGLWTMADDADGLLNRAQTLGFNQFFNRTFAGRYPLRFHGEESQFLEALRNRLAQNPDGVDPYKADFGFSHLHALGLYGGWGLREWLILLNMDAGLPLGTGHDRRAPEQFQREVRDYATALKDLPAFEGFCWNQNWWIFANDWYQNAEQKVAFEAAYRKALETGEWAPILDEVGEMHFHWQTEAQALLGGFLAEVEPKRTTAAASPWRRPEIYPPTNFANVDEISLHFQSEQITAPNWTAHAADFYGLKGKPNWLHPEWFNEDGTGEHFTSLTWMGLMRGAGGIGTNEAFRLFPRPEIDPRIGYHGFPSVLAAVQQWARRYGDWLLTLDNRDRVAIAVSERQIKIDSFQLRSGGVGGVYFSRLFEAYQSFLHTDYPATFLFAEELEQGGLDGIEALMVVSQEVEPGPKLRRLLDEVRRRRIPIYADGNCREGLVLDAHPLGVTFDRLDNVHAMNNDMAFFTYPQVFVEQAQELRPILSGLATRVASQRGHPEVLVSERGNQDLHAIWVVNNRHANLDPGILWRVGGAITPRLPAPMDLSIELRPGELLYELAEPQRVAAFPRPNLFRRLARVPEAQPRTERIQATLRGGEARMYVILPESGQDIRLSLSGVLAPGANITWAVTVPGVKASLPVRIELRDGNGMLLQGRDTVSGSGSLTVPANAPGPFSFSVRNLISGRVAAVGNAPAPAPLAGVGLATPRLRDAAISADGQTLLVNALDWGVNLHLLNLATGEPLGTARVGHYQAFASIAAGNRFLVQGFDLLNGEGYHSYLLDGQGAVERRFAHPGFPQRMKPWAFPLRLALPDGGHVAPPDGSWLAVAGTLGVAVWTPTGERLWHLGEFAAPRLRRVLAVVDGFLALIEGNEIRAYRVDPSRPGGPPPSPAWTVVLPDASPILGHAVDRAARRLAVWTAEKGGRIHVVESGRLALTIAGPVEAAAISADGRVAAVEGSRLHRYSAAGLPVWSASLGGAGFFPVYSPDGTRLAVATAFGETRIYDAQSGHLAARAETASVARPLWLANGDLVTVEWLGRISRWSPTGDPRWSRQIELPPVDTAALANPKDERVPTSRWTSAEQGPDTIDPRPNLLEPDSTLVRQWDGKRYHSLARDPGPLFDGDLTPPEEPWLSWETVGFADSGWRGSYTLEIDTFRRLLEVDTVAFVEDPDHPASWLRDLHLDVWDAEQAQWQFVAYLTSDRPTHVHRLENPVRGGRFRIQAAQPGRGWPAGNLRLAEILFQGRDLGNSHPDVAAKRPLAVLFDEDELFQLVGQPGSPPIYLRGGAASGGTSLRATAGKAIYPFHFHRFGHALAHFDFVLAQNPRPGEYRWLEFQVKALSPDTTAAGLLLSDAGINGFLLEVGTPGSTFHVPHQPFIRLPVAATVAGEWTAYRVDLWNILAEHQPPWAETFRIRGLRLEAAGGDAVFDRILLARDKADLDAAKP